MDGAGRIYVVNGSQQTVTEYNTGAAGDATPFATISGSATGLSSPDALSVDAEGHLWVANAGTNSLTEYAATASGNAVPMAIISGASTGINGPLGITTTPSGGILVANRYGETETLPRRLKRGRSSGSLRFLAPTRE